MIAYGWKRAIVRLTTCALFGFPSVSIAGDPGCSGRQHDGGDGTCMSMMRCSAGYALDAAGHCSRWAPTVSQSNIFQKN